MQVTMEELLQATGGVGEVGSGEQVFTRVRTDSRLVEKGDLFFCIAGDRLDGHSFVSEAVSRGAGAIVAHRPLEPDSEVPVVLVRDTLVALGRLARFWREKSRAVVIGVTGSAGKTTVKEMLAAVLGNVGETGKNFRNWNNQLGLPLSMLAMSGQERFWVLELGISVPGDMSDLGAILGPDVAVVLNIGPCHLQGLGSEQGVAGEKSVVLDHLAPGGKGLLSRDYPALVAEAQGRGRDVRFFSRSCPDAPVCVDYLGPEHEQGTFRVRCHGREMVMGLPLHGEHMAENLAAVVSVVHELGLDPEIVWDGLQEFQPAPQRFVLRRKGAWTIIDDTYNANPLSMRHAVLQAAELAGGRQLVFVLGDMLELGNAAATEHEELGRLVASKGPRHVYYFGEFEGAFRDGLDGLGGRCRTLSSPEMFAASFGDLPSAGGVILFKGSRGCGMERFLKVFSEHIK
jgi:UDP-N-acetylmuramoyl-tripeptide--D-alanyl-D-alanine ligase